MNKLKTFALMMLTTMSITGTAQTTPVSQMEQLDRGVVALTAASGTGNFISWRFLGTDDENTTTFDLLRNGSRVKSNLYATNCVDASGNATSTYQVVTKVNGEPVDTSEAVTAWGAISKTLTLDRPAGGTLPFRPYDSSTKKYGSFSDTPYTYSPNDMSVGDVDGDGQYELFVKWDPSNSQDNSQQCGKTGNVYIDCYKLDGTKLWRVDLGQNIRAGAHYTQYMVYDFDGDGRVEMMCKTAPGSKDGLGNYVNQAATDATITAADNTKDHRNTNGAITGGQEYLTVFDGETGKAIHTIFYNPNRNQGYGGAADGSFNWGQPDGKSDAASYGNRGERYLAGVAYLDGPDNNPSGIFSRGYYGYAFIWAVDFDGNQLKQKWLSAHKSKTSYSLTTYDASGNGSTKSFNSTKSSSGEGRNTMFANGNHNLSIADVDNDGKDEIIWGSAACDDNGRLLYAVGFGHGDAIHMSDLAPERPGLEVFQVHEDKGTYAWDVHDAATGEIIAKGGPSGVDNGRGMAAQLDAAFHGFYISSSSAREQRSAITGEQVSSGQTSLNFRIYWDGNLQDELLDGTKIDKWTGSGTSRLTTLSGSTCNGTKNTPNLQADILGDWREEVILHNGSDQIIIYSTNTATNYRMPTLMHDHTYRMGICWQNVAYNQPPHLGYYLPDAQMPHLVQHEYTVNMGEEFEVVAPVYYASTIDIKASFKPDGTKTTLVVPVGMTRITDTTYKTFGVKGIADQEGDYVFALSMKDRGGSNTYADTLIIHSVNTTGIEYVKSSTPDSREVRIYDAAGRLTPYHTTDGLPQGLYIVREGQRTKKVLILKK